MLDSESQLKEAIQQMLQPKKELAVDKSAPAEQGKNLDGLFDDQPAKKKDQDLNDLF